MKPFILAGVFVALAVITGTTSPVQASNHPDPATASAPDKTAEAPILASGVVKRADGSTVAGARVSAEIIIPFESGEFWRPLTSATTDASGRFTLRASTRHPEAAARIAASGDLRVAFSATEADGSTLSMWTDQLDRGAARAGRWEAEGADSASEIGAVLHRDGSSSALTSWADRHASRVDGQVHGTVGSSPRTGLELVLVLSDNPLQTDPSPAGREATESAKAMMPTTVDPGAVEAAARLIEAPATRSPDGTEATAAALAFSPGYQTCIDLYGEGRFQGNDPTRWSWYWARTGAETRWPVQVGYARTEFGTASLEWTVSGSSATEVELGWSGLDGRVQGKLGYQRESQGAFGDTISVPAFSNHALTMEMLYEQQQMWCLYNPGSTNPEQWEHLPVWLYYWAPERWTGGSATFPTLQLPTRFAPDRNKICAQTGFWVSRTETQVFSTGAGVGFANLASKVTTSASMKLTYFPATGHTAQVLIGSNATPASATFVAQVHGYRAPPCP